MGQSSTQSRSHWPIVILSSFSSLLGLLLPLVLVRVLSPMEVGNFKIFFLYLTIIPAFSFSTGIMSGLAYWAGQPSESRKTLQTSATLLLIFALIFGLLAFVAHPAVAATFGWNNRESILFAAALVGAIAASFFEEAAISTGKIWTGALFYSGFELLRTISIISALFYYRSLTAVLVAHTSIITLKLILGYLYGIHLKLVAFRLSKEEVKSVWRYAFPVSLAWVFGIFVSSADQLILSTFIPAAEFALYSIGCLSIAPLLIFEHAITRVVIPQMSEASSKEDNEKLSSLYHDAVNNLGFILIPSVAGLIVFAEPIIEVCFTKQYASAAQYLRLYALSYLLLIIPYDAHARANGHSSWILRTFIRFSILSLALAILFTKVWGPFGAMSAVLLSGALLRIYAIDHFGKESGKSFREFLPITPLVSYLCICVVLSGAALSVRSAFVDQRVWLLVVGLAFWVCYLSAAFALKNRAGRIRRSTGGVLVVTQSLNIGGLERMILHLCERLQQDSKWPISVLAYDQPEDTASLIPLFIERGISVEAFQKSSGFSFYSVYRILKTVITKKIRILHSHDLGSLIYAVAAKIACLGKVTIVHTQHSFIHLQRKSRYRLYEKLTTYFVDTLCVVSEETKKIYLEMGFSKDKIFVIQNGVHFPERHPVTFEERLAKREALIASISTESASDLQPFIQDYWILYLGRFFPGKGQEDALLVWSELPQEIRARSVLCYVGPESQVGQYGAFQERCSAAPSKERILTLGSTNVPGAWMAACDMFLSCSAFEGMPLGPLEAAGSGMPTVLSEIPGHDFLKEYAEFFELHNAAAGADCVTAVVSKLDRNREDFLSDLWAQNNVLREKHSIDRMARSYARLYTESASLEPDAFSLLEASFG